MKLMVTGAKGLLGYEFVRLGRARDIELVALGHEDLDVTREEDVAAAMDEHAPDVVIHCAAFTHVDGAEADPEGARAVNVNGARIVAEAAPRLVTFSTDYVFDGGKRTPYLPSDLPHPLSVYGRTKLDGERAVLAARPDALVVRTSWLYGKGGRSFVPTMLEFAGAGRTLRIVDDQQGRPTWAGNLARTTLELLAADARGIWHVTDGGTATWLALATAAFEIRGLEVDVEPVSTRDWAAPAARPLYSVLDIGATEVLLGRPMTHWRNALARFLREESDGEDG